MQGLGHDGRSSPSASAWAGEGIQETLSWALGFAAPAPSDLSAKLLVPMDKAEELRLLCEIPGEGGSPLSSLHSQFRVCTLFSFPPIWGVALRNLCFLWLINGATTPPPSQLCPVLHRVPPAGSSVGADSATSKG